MAGNKFNTYEHCRDCKYAAKDFNYHYQERLYCDNIGARKYGKTINKAQACIDFKSKHTEEKPVRSTLMYYIVKPVYPDAASMYYTNAWVDENEYKKLCNKWGAKNIHVLSKKGMGA